jgi:hypothetical protein
MILLYGASHVMHQLAAFAKALRAIMAIVDVTSVAQKVYI